MPASKEWTSRQSKVVDECYYCHKTTRLKEDPVNANLACKTCYTSIETLSSKDYGPTVCKTCHIDFVMAKVLAGHILRKHPEEVKND